MPVETNRIERSHPPLRFLSFGLIAFGIIVRVIQYLSHRSLWDDEATLASNIVNRSYLDLLGMLDNNQAAPPLFLWLEKLSVQVFGINEFALRLLPLLAGIVSLFLFYKLANQFLVGSAIPLAIALFASLKYTVYYSGEVKPYSTDLAISLILFLTLQSNLKQWLSLKKNCLLGFLGALSIWLSYPSIFVLSGVELFGWLHTPWRKLKSTLLNRAAMYSFWLISFLSLYFIVISQALGNDDLVNSWADRYPDSWLDILWLINAFGRFFYRPLGFLSWADGIAMFAFCCGLFSFYRRDKSSLLLLNMPLLVTLLASYLHQYPFRDRLIYFLTPFALLIVSEGSFSLLQKWAQHRLIKVFGILVLCALVLPPIARTSQQVLRPQLFHFHHARPVIQYVQVNWKADDHLLVFPSAHHQFNFYTLITPFEPGTYSFTQYDIPNEKDFVRRSQPIKDEFWQEVAQFQGQERMWFLLSTRADIVQNALLEHLDQVGRQLDVYRQTDAMACLYDLSLND